MTDELNADEKAYVYDLPVTDEQIDRKRFEQAPCYLCGYNGHSYYQPNVHKCAKKYHAKDNDAMTDEQKVTRYNFLDGILPPGYGVYAQPADDGDFVPFRDYDALRRRVEGMESALRCIEGHCGNWQPIIQRLIDQALSPGESP